MKIQTRNPSEEEERFMNMAIEESKKSLTLKEGGCFGCVIVKEGKVIGIGHNQVIKNNDPTCHGEMQAIRDACKNLGTFELNGCDLYTSAMPCPMCFGAIYWARIKNIYFGATDEDTAKIGFDDRYIYEVIRGTHKGKDEIPMYNILRSEAVNVQKDYSEMVDKQMY